MKKIKYFFIPGFIFLMGCQQPEGYLYNDVARIQLKNNNDVAYSFVWESKTTTRDTVYLPLMVIGGPDTRVRDFHVSQITEFNVEYEYDNKGYVIDSTVTEIFNKAIPGIHYVPFDDPGAKELMKVSANQVESSVPVILLRDKSLQSESQRLRIQLEPSTDFQLGEQEKLSATVIFSDKLEKPNSWTAMINLWLGDYSVPKHELMIEVVGGKVDDDWLSKGKANNAFFVFWRGKFIDALERFNADPTNIANGTAPLRSDPKNPNSARVDFPTKMV